MKSLIFITFVSTLFGCLILGSCNLSDEIRSVHGGWKFYDEGDSNCVILKGEKFIPCQILKYGYDDDYIIATQRPTATCFNGVDTNHYPIGSNGVYYWIIVQATDSLIGPLTQKEFEAARIRMQIPTDLELRSLY